MSNFWKDFSFPSPIDDLLPNPNCTLEELLDEDDVIRDSRSHKQILVDFLARPQHVEKLFSYVTKEAPSDASDKVKFRYPVIACEILVAEVTEIEKVIFGDPDKYLGALLDFWKPPQVNTPLAALVSRTLSALLVSNTTETLGYLKSHPDILDHFVDHVSAGTVKDHIGRMLNLEGENTQLAVNWLISENIFGKYISKFAPEFKNIHGDVADAIEDLLELSGFESPLFKSFNLDNNLPTLFEHMLAENNRSALLHGLQVTNRLIEMIATAEHNSISTEDTTMPPIVSTSIDHIPLLLPILKEDYPTSFTLAAGTPIKPFGGYRLRLVQLFDVLLMLEYDAVDAALMANNIFPLLIDLFLLYEHNNILHKMVEVIILRVLHGTNDEMTLSLFNPPCNIHLKLIEGYKEKSTPEAAARSPANMPYILNLSEKLNEMALNKSEIADILKDSTEWMQYEKEVLANARAEAQKVLGGTPPERMGGYGHDMGQSSFSDVIAHDDDDDDDDDSGSTSDDGDDGDEDEEEDDLELPDDTDMSSDTDYRDYDSSQSEVLLSKLEIEELLEG